MVAGRRSGCAPWRVLLCLFAIRSRRCPGSSFHTQIYIYIRLYTQMFSARRVREGNLKRLSKLGRKMCRALQNLGAALSQFGTLTRMSSISSLKASLWRKAALTAACLARTGNATVTECQMSDNRFRQKSPTLFCVCPARM